MRNEKTGVEEYLEVEYMQFQPGKSVRVTMAVLGVLTWPITWPLAMLGRISDIIFRSISEFLSLMPYFPGVILRYEFYRFALRRCGKNVVIEFGAVFCYADVEIGDNVLVGRFSIMHLCDIGSDVLVGERCTFLSGARQHHHKRIDIPMSRQGGARKRISIGDDCWIGSHSVVTEDIATGCIIGAASVVSRSLPPYSVAVGCPAKVVRDRSEKS